MHVIEPGARRHRSRPRACMGGGVAYRVSCELIKGVMDGREVASDVRSHCARTVSCMSDCVGRVPRASRFGMRLAQLYV